jgi:hypothetical protein
MLSVIILCETTRSPDSALVPEAVVRTLGALVSASVHGLVRDVVLAGPQHANLGLIADHAGCSCVEAASEAECLRRALALVRAEDLLVLRPGHILETGFIDEIEDLLAEGALHGGRRIYAAPGTYWQRLIPALLPVVGLVASIESCRTLNDEGTEGLATLVRATRSRTALRSRARRVR